MADLRIVFNRDAFRQLRTIPEVSDYLDDAAQRLADSCGGEAAGYFAHGRDNPYNRDRAAVVTGTAEAMVHEAVTHELLRNIHRAAQ